MRIKNIDAPVLVLACKIGALGIMRSLGSQGIKVYGVDSASDRAALRSRYCTKTYIKSFDESVPEDYLDFILGIGKELGKGTVLIPTNDLLALFVCQFAEQLSEYFRFPENDPSLMTGLSSKEEMYSLATDNGIPTASTWFPQNQSDVISIADEIEFPVMLKGIYGDKLQQRTGKKMLIVNDREELLKNYNLLENPDSPNLMIQELIPGDDDQVYIFNGYFNEDSDCLAAFTGHKLRQFPVHVGCASLGICSWNNRVAEKTIHFMKQVGYRGILDIGYRLDPRDGKYKVLDINPRIGGAFRLFVAENGMDVARSLYLDLTAQEAFEVNPREGRKWMIEDADLVSCLHYDREGTLTLSQWLRSFKGLEEGAWFSWSDPKPFLATLRQFLVKFLCWMKKKLSFRRNRSYAGLSRL